MKQDIISVDIETAPRLDLVKDFYPYNKSKVAYGNAKTPEARKKAEDKHKESWFPKLNAKAALNPVTAEVCAIGYKTADSKNLDIRPSEMDMIKGFWSIYLDIKKGAMGRKAICGWNIFGFDLPFMIKRSWILGLDVPAGVTNGRYHDLIFKDIKQEYHRHEYGWEKMDGLEFVAKVLGCQSPRTGNVKGKDFYKLLNTTTDDLKKAEEYLSADVTECYNIAQVVL